jgi:arsenate reductase
MREIGVDGSTHTSKTLDSFRTQPFDYVITVCDRANESCPIFSSGGERIHWIFEDPSAASGSEEQRLQTFRAIRDLILERLRVFMVEDERTT